MKEKEKQDWLEYGKQANKQAEQALLQRERDQAKRLEAIKNEYSTVPKKLAIDSNHDNNTVFHINTGTPELKNTRVSRAEGGLRTAMNSSP